MKKYKNNEISEIICNSCGRSIKTEHGIVKEGVVMAEIRWGYFSMKDGETHSFDVCEECYDKLINGFAVPVEKKKIREFL